MRVSVPVSRILAVKEPKPHIRVSIARAQHKLADLAENRPKVIAQLGFFGLCEGDLVRMWIYSRIIYNLCIHAGIVLVKKGGTNSSPTGSATHWCGSV